MICWFLGPRPEPVEIVWDDGIEVTYGIETEWWTHSLAVRARTYA
jgi:hypothetical protein